MLTWASVYCVQAKTERCFCYISRCFHYCNFRRPFFLRVVGELQSRAVWRMRDKFISKLDVLHFCSTAAGGASIKRTASKGLFETQRHWSPSLDGCHAALMACVCVCPCVFSEIFCAKWKSEGREKGGNLKGGETLCNVNSSGNWSQQLYYTLFKRGWVLWILPLQCIPLLLQCISRFL